jgi:hypothetical protein
MCQGIVDWMTIVGARFGTSKELCRNEEFHFTELIESAANELRLLRTKKIDDPVMQFTSCELELSVTVKAEAGGALRFWILDAAA